MIKFFRKIRQGLLTEKKFSKYLLYAIGEIILVVVGILIALSINNWNEEKKLIDREIGYLNELSGEFKANKIILEDFLSQLNNSLADSENLLSIKNSDTIRLNDFEIIYSIETVGWATNINFTKNVWNDIYSTGNAMIFNDLLLQDRMSSFYARANYYETLIAELDNYKKNYRNISKYIMDANLRIELADKVISQDTTSNFKTDNDLEVILEKFKSNKRIDGELADIIMLTKAATVVGQSINERLGITISLIDKQINKITKG